MQNAIEASGLTKYYDDFLAVDHISFNVEKGEIFGFLGPNGAGIGTILCCWIYERLVTDLGEKAWASG